MTLPRTAQLDALLTVLRDSTTPRGEFIFVADRIIRLLVEEGLNHLPVIEKSQSQENHAPRSKRFLILSGADSDW